MAGLLEDPVQYESITQLAVPWGPGQLTYNEGTQCALMVDEYSRVIVNDNQSAVNSSNGLFSPASVPTPWNEVGKCTYRVFMEFRKRGRHGVPDSEVSQWSYGTAVHIGQGLFLSNSHVFSCPRDLGTTVALTHFVRFRTSASHTLSVRQQHTIPLSFFPKEIFISIAIATAVQALVPPAALSYHINALPSA
jgi:hypothetical protein